MKKFLLAMVMVASTLAMTVTDADAKRLGGGGSSGRQSQNVSRQATPATPANPGNAANQAKPGAPAAAPAAAVPPKPATPWKGIVGGLIGGALLAGVLSHFGLGGAVASMLGSLLTFAAIGLLIFFLFRLFRGNKAAPANAFSQPAYAGVPQAQSFNQAQPQFQPEPQAYQSAQTQTAVDPNAGSWTIPADFDVPGFLRSSKSYFIRLQAAWDKADINDLREFTTGEMFAELKLQLQERGASANVTDVVSIDADLLGIEQVGNDYMASVKFTGLIKEAANAPTEPFAEVWNLSKPANGQGGWVLAGIQQV